MSVFVIFCFYSLQTNFSTRAIHYLPNFHLAKIKLSYLHNKVVDSVAPTETTFCSLGLNNIVKVYSEGFF